jgi:hypothetical protein
MTSRRLISDKANTYIDLLRIYYYPDKSYSEVLDGIIDAFEMQYELKSKLLEE